MKRKMLYVGIIALIIFASGSYFFFKKNYLDYELVSQIPNSNEEFHPMAYEFFHSKNAYESFFARNTNTIKLKTVFPNSSNLDFENYSYCIFFGKSLNSLYYSYKTTYYDDPSPSYASCRRKGKKFVQAIYNETNQNNDKGIFLYKVKKDEGLSGVDGL